MLTAVLQWASACYLESKPVLSGTGKRSRGEVLSRLFSILTQREVVKGGGGGS